MSSFSGEVVRLTHDGKLKATPVFVKGGEELVYVLLENPALFRLMRRSMKDGKIEPMHDETKHSELDPTSTPDGRYFAFGRNHAILAVQIVIRDTTANREAFVQPGDGFSALRSPAIAPDGSRVLFAYADGGRQQIISVDAQAGDRKKLTDSAGISNWPSYSADGKEIVFSSTRDGNYEIYVMNADGSNVRRLTHCPYQDIRPSFSPDGSRIAFTSARDGNYEIYVMNRDGSNLQRVTNHPERDDYAAWHPDGKRLAIVCERNGSHDLYMVDVPG